MAIQLGFEPGDFTLKTWRAVAAEFIATALFVFIGTGAVVAARAGVVAASENAAPPEFVIAVALAHGLAIALLVAATAKISGGHINPAVSFAAAATGKMKVSTAALYIAAQLVAAIVGSLMLKAVIAGPMEGGLGALSINVYDPDLAGGLLDNSVGDGAGAGLLVETVLTFALVFVVFATAMDPKGLGFIAPAAIGLTVLVDHLIGVPLTGAGMNPARAFGPAVVAGEWADQWIYWVGPLIGAAIAALVYEYVFLNREE